MVLKNLLVPFVNIARQLIFLIMESIEQLSYFSCIDSISSDQTSSGEFFLEF